MDLNQLLDQHQRALLSRSERDAAGGSHSFDLVAYYERRIRNLRQKLGVRQYSWRG